MLDHDLDRGAWERVVYRLYRVLIDDPGSGRRTAGIEQLEVNVGLERRVKSGEPGGQLCSIDATGRDTAPNTLMMKQPETKVGFASTPPSAVVYRERQA